MGTMPVVPLLQEVREFTAAGFALLRMRDRWEYFQTKPPGGDEHGYALLFRDAAGCGENPFAAAPASAVAGWVILLLYLFSGWFMGLLFERRCNGEGRHRL